MKTVKLGNSNARVSEMCFGAMWFGTRNNEQSSFQLLDRYADAGGSFVDTANIYARAPQINPNFQGGESEVVLRKWFQTRGKRHEIFIASKVGFEYKDQTRGLSAKQIVTECEGSLKRMGIETIDLYYAHVDDRTTPLDETLEAFNRLVEAGKVRYLGASNYLAWRLEQARCLSQAHGWPQFCCIQQRYSYLRPKPGATFAPQISANGDLLDYCAAEGVTMLAYSPLLSGAYTRPDRAFPDQHVGPDSEARLFTLQAVAEEVNATANQVVLAWMMQSKPAVIPVIGATTIDQLNEILGTVEVALSEDQMTRLDSASS